MKEEGIGEKRGVWRVKRKCNFNLKKKKKDGSVI